MIRYTPNHNRRTYTLALLCAILATTGCSNLEYVPERNNYSAEASKYIKSKDRQLGTLYLGKSARKDQELALHIDRRNGRYRAKKTIMYTPAPTDFALSSRGKDLRAGLEWSWKF